MNIHKTAIIDKKAKLAGNVAVGPYSVIGANVKIGAGTIIGAHCIIDENTSIGKNCSIFTGAIIGSQTQDKKFKGKKTFLEIGNNNTIREYVTINKGTDEDTKTIIGNDNLFMAYSHIAHNCVIGNGITIANASQLAGHVLIQDSVIIGGLTGAHQFVRIGKLAIIGGCSKIVQDIVPFAMTDGHPARIYGINSVGLERAGYPENVKETLKKAFKIIFSMKLSIKTALKKIEDEIPPTKEIKELTKFIKSAERGIAR